MTLIRMERKQNSQLIKKHVALYSIVISYHLLALKSGTEFLPIIQIDTPM